MHFMNPQRGAHMKGGDGHGHHGGPSSTPHHPHIHVHSHSGGHTVHIMHHDGQHESFEHEPGDAEGIAAHVHEHIGAAGGQPVNEGEAGYGGMHGGGGEEAE